MKQEKEQEQKFLYSSRKQKGQTLFAFNPDDNTVYKVEIEKESVIFKKKEKIIYKAQVNPKHPVMWALNLKNAKRKLGIK